MYQDGDDFYSDVTTEAHDTEGKLRADDTDRVQVILDVFQAMNRLLRTISTQHGAFKMAESRLRDVLFMHILSLPRFLSFLLNFNFNLKLGSFFKMTSDSISTNLRSDSFAVDDYIACHYTEYKIKELENEITKLKELDMKKSVQMKSVMLTHFEDFITCDKVLQNVSHSMSNNDTETFEKEQLQNIQTIQNTVTPLLTQNHTKSQMEITRNLLLHYQYLFEIPLLFKTFYRDKKYTQVHKNKSFLEKKKLF